MGQTNLEQARDEVGSGWGYARPDRVKLTQEWGGKHILDLGCGKGGYVHELNRLGFKCTGYDIFPVKGLRFVQGDLKSLPFRKKCFDTVLLFNLLEHVENDVAVLKEAAQIAKKNIIISVPLEENDITAKFEITYHPYVDLSHKRYYTKPEFQKTLLDLNFKIDYCRPVLPLNPLGLFLNSMGLPLQISRKIGNKINRLPFIKKYYTTLYIVVSHG